MGDIFAVVGFLILLQFCCEEAGAKRFVGVTCWLMNPSGRRGGKETNGLPSGRLAHDAFQKILRERQPNSHEWVNC
jgi:hypothetical protein